jgi:DNA-binding transcriptional LysR family regulator
MLLPIPLSCSHRLGAGTIVRRKPRGLEYFDVIAEHGNLRRAADALGMSQPALSKSLRRSERWAGAKLVERTPKGIRLTDLGTALSAGAKRLQV